MYMYTYTYIYICNVIDSQMAKMLPQRLFAAATLWYLLFKWYSSLSPWAARTVQLRVQDASCSSSAPAARQHSCWELLHTGDVWSVSISLALNVLVDAKAVTLKKYCKATDELSVQEFPSLVTWGMKGEHVSSEAAHWFMPQGHVSCLKLGSGWQVLRFLQ